MIIESLITGLITSIIFTLLQIYISSRSDLLKDNILLERIFISGEKELDRYISNYEHNNFIKYSNYINLSSNFNDCEMKPYLEIEEIKNDEITIFKPLNDIFYNIKINKYVDLDLNGNLITEEISSIDTLNCNQAIFLFVYYSEGIPMYTISWEDRYGYSGEIEFSENGYNSIVSLNTYIYKNSFIKELKRVLNISKLK